MKAVRVIPLASLAALAMSALLPAPAAAQVSGYTATREAAQYRPIPIEGGQEPVILTTGSTEPSGNNGKIVDARLPFTYFFYGKPYSVAHISSGGALSFASKTFLMSPTSFPTGSAAPLALIAAWWDKMICGEGNPGSQTPNSGHMKTQVLGTAPNRIFVIEWDRCRPHVTPTEVSDIQVQIWLYEASDDIEVRYGSIRPGTFKAYMALKSDSPGSLVTWGPGYTGAPCEQQTCKSGDFPANSVTTYSWNRANPVVEAVEGDLVGRPGLPYKVRTTVRNRGNNAATNLDIRYYINTQPVLNGQAIPLLTGARTYAVGKGTDLIIEDAPVLPLTLGQVDPLEPNKPVVRDWYIIAEIDTTQQFEGNPDRRKGVGPYRDVSGTVRPFRVPDPAPDPAVGKVEVAEQIKVGVPFTVRWEALNVGDMPIEDVEYRLVLSRFPDVTSASLPLSSPGAQGRISLGKFDKKDLVVTATIDESAIESGTYYIGVEMAPNGVAEHIVWEPDGKGGQKVKSRHAEYTRNNNTGASRALVLINDKVLSIKNEEMPAAQLGGPYSVRLSAIGGDGVHRWSTRSGTALPPGLRLEEDPPGARALGQPFATFLRGTPAAAGTFPFVLRVISMGLDDEREFELTVSRGAPPLAISTANLPFASFGREYETVLNGTGGRAPYTWGIHKGRLPAGLTLRSDGVLVGRPVEDGAFEISLRITDSEDESASRSFQLMVSSPASLTCVTRELPPLPLGVTMEPIQLAAAGGAKPYTWRTDKTQAFAGGFDQKGDYLPNGIAPPGLILNENGTVTGTPQEVGDYIWTVRVHEDGKSIPTECPILVRVPLDQGITVISQGLPTALVGKRYQGRLEAAGGVGNLTWSLVGSSPIIRDGSGDAAKALELKPSGEIEGIIRQEDLGEEEEKSYSFLVRVKDENNRQGLAAVSVRARTRAEVAPKAEEEGSL